MKFADAKRAAVKMISSEAFYERIKEEDDSMLKQLPLLKEINSLGFLTIESQAGRRTAGAKSFRTGKPYVISERAYLCGFMKTAAAGKFIKLMGIETDKNAVVITHCKEIDLPRELDIPLTITESGGETEVSTHTSMGLPTMVYESYMKMAKLNKGEDVVFVLCWDVQWNRLASGRNGLFVDVVRVLKGL